MHLLAVPPIKVVRELFAQGQPVLPHRPVPRFSGAEPDFFSRKVNVVPPEPEDFGFATRCLEVAIEKNPLLPTRHCHNPQDVFWGRGVAELLIKILKKKRQE